MVNTSFLTSLYLFKEEVNTSFLTSLYLFKEEFAEKLSDEAIFL